MRGPRCERFCPHHRTCYHYHAKKPRLTIRVIVTHLSRAAESLDSVTAQRWCHTQDFLYTMYRKTLSIPQVLAQKGSMMMEDCARNADVSLIYIPAPIIKKVYKN